MAILISGGQEFEPHLISTFNSLRETPDQRGLRYVVVNRQVALGNEVAALVVADGAKLELLNHGRAAQGDGFILFEPERIIFQGTPTLPFLDINLNKLDTNNPDSVAWSKRLVLATLIPLFVAAGLKNIPYFHRPTLNPSGSLKELLPA